MDLFSSIELQMTAKSLEESVIGNARFLQKILQKLDIFANFYIGSHIESTKREKHHFPMCVTSGAHADASAPEVTH